MGTPVSLLAMPNSKEKLDTVEKQLGVLEGRINKLSARGAPQDLKQGTLKAPLLTQNKSADSIAGQDDLTILQFLKKKAALGPFPNSFKEQQGKWHLVIGKWFLPGFLNAFCIFISMWLLHIATYQYVHKMTNMEESLKKSGINSEEVLSKFFNDYSTLADPVADVFPRESIALDTLDKVAAFFPAMFMLGVVAFDDLRLYTKIMFCNAFLALLKGSLDAMTVLPDSAGWAACKERLTPLGVAFFQENHSPWDLLRHEATGVNGHHLRWCSDMLVSGHTYFTTIYALGCYELIRRVMLQEGFKHRELLKAAAITFVVVMGLFEQMIEIYAVTVDRFHYTMDVYLAIIVTFIVYTNAIPAMVSKHWWGMGTVFSMTKEERYEFMGSAFNSESDILMPVCCFPFCCLAGRMHLFDDDHLKHISNLHEVATMNKKEKAEFQERNLVGEGVRFSKLANAVKAIARDKKSVESQV